jgi:hypothetical protein
VRSDEIRRIYLRLRNAAGGDGGLREGVEAMNSASQNFPHHLAELRERMLHPTDYERAVYYFLEEFAGDRAFVRASDVDSMPHLVAVLGHIASKAIGRRVEVEGALVSHLRAHRFIHGNAQVDGRVVLFFYFQDADTGMMMLIPGVRGQGDWRGFILREGWWIRRRIEVYANFR